MLCARPRCSRHCHRGPQPSMSCAAPSLTIHIHNTTPTLPPQALGMPSAAIVIIPSLTCTSASRHLTCTSASRRVSMPLLPPPPNSRCRAVAAACGAARAKHASAQASRAVPTPAVTLAGSGAAGAGSPSPCGAEGACKALRSARSAASWLLAAAPGAQAASSTCALMRLRKLAQSVAHQPRFRWPSCTHLAAEESWKHRQF